MNTNQEYKNIALAALKGNWAPAVVCAIVYMVVTGIYSSFSVLNADGTDRKSVV